MKNLIIFSLFISVLLFSSCNDVLEQYPTDRLSSGTFWKSKADFNMALASCYNTVQDYYLCTGIHDLDGLSDNALCVFDYGNESSINQNISVSSHATDFWYYDGYSRLAVYNNFLKRLSEYKGTDINDSDKSGFEAQVRLLRAMEYYRLYVFYGSVPLVLEPLTIETQNVPKSEATQIFNQIITDCDFAIANLPSTSFWTASGHLNKAAAEMVKARAYLYVGYDDSGNAKKDEMNKVISLTTSIINSGFYNLGTYYRGLFSHNLGQQESNPEYVFATHFLAPNNSKQGLWSFNISTMQFYWQSVHVLPSLLNAYEFSDGTPFNPSDPRVDNNYLYNNRDPRMAQTVCKDIVNWEDGTSQQLGSIKWPEIPYLFWKTCDKDEVTQNGGVNAQKQNTQNTAYVPLIRYAEVLLSYAEALNEVNGPVAEVYNAINAIRARAKMPDLQKGLSKEEMREKIRHERRIELAFEGFRYFDIKRWKIAGGVLNGLNDGIVTRKFESPKNYLWPLPEQEILINTALEQNPDYK